MYECVILGYHGHLGDAGAVAGHMRRDLRVVLCVQGCTSPQIFTEQLLYNSGHMTISQTHAKEHDALLYTVKLLKPLNLRIQWIDLRPILNWCTLTFTNLLNFAPDGSRSFTQEPSIF